MFFVYPRIKKWDMRHHHQRLPRRPRRHHVPRATGSSPFGAIIIGAIAGVVVVARRRLHRVAPHRRPDRRRRRARLLRHLGHVEPRAVRHRAITALPGPTGRRHVGGDRRRACSTAAAPTSWSPSSSAARTSSCAPLAAGLAAHVRRSRRPARCASPKRASSKGIDIHEHGAPAYHPEPAYDGYSPIPSIKTGAKAFEPVGADQKE